MTKLIVIVGLSLLLSPKVHAQDRPKVEVFGGVSYTRVRLPDENLTAKGWHAMVTVNSALGWVDLVADFSSHRGSLGEATTKTNVAMAGFRTSLQIGRLVLFAHTLYGVSFGHPPLFRDQEIAPKQRVWFTFAPIGGGADIVLTRNIALRIAQFDLIFHTKAPDYSQTFLQESYSTRQYRFSCGIVLRFGKA